ncbi:MAG: exodeoxyribonuclease III [Maricaulaceae bacterium]
MKLATWNVNSVKARLPTVLDWFRGADPDVACLQEIKCVDDTFPRLEFEDLGYVVATHGQKSYNGVAILSKSPLQDVTPGLPGDPDDDQARYLEAVVDAPGGAVRVASLYLPNGNPAPGPKYDYKLSWMDRLIDHARDRLKLEEALVLAGDYNAIPRAEDVHDPVAWAEDALFRPATRAKFQALKWLGLTEAFEALDDRAHQYTFWDYQGGAWPKDHGVRIDHCLLSPQAADRLSMIQIHRDARAMTKPSDHAPVMIDLTSHP